MSKPSICRLSPTTVQNKENPEERNRTSNGTRRSRNHRGTHKIEGEEYAFGQSNLDSGKIPGIKLGEQFPGRGSCDSMTPNPEVVCIKLPCVKSGNRGPMFFDMIIIIFI